MRILAVCVAIMAAAGWVAPAAGAVDGPVARAVEGRVAGPVDGRVAGATGGSEADLAYHGSASVASGWVDVRFTPQPHS